MKLQFFALASLLATLTLTSPVEKRATLTDVCTTGYATTNGGTTGGKGGPTVTVTTEAALIAALADDLPRIILISGTITGGNHLRVGSNKSIIGKAGSKMVGIGFFVWKKKNVILRNLTIQKVLTANQDAIGIQESTNVWVDHCDLSSDKLHDGDYYDGLCDISHAADWVTVSNTYFHDHWKTSLVGHSDNNAAQDTGHLHVTYHNNYFHNVNSRTPSLRYGVAHVYNNLYSPINTGIDVRDGAQALVQSNVFRDSTLPLFSGYSKVVGYAVSQDNDFGNATNTAPQGTLTTVPYAYSLLGSKNVAASVAVTAGANLGF